MLAYVRSLPDGALIDRLVRGRAWIPALGVMLAGIVFMQVEALKLGAAYGQAIQQTSQLTATNSTLRLTTDELGSDQRIETEAARLGMIMPGPSAVGFLAASGGAPQALGRIQAPDATQFLADTSTSNGDIAALAALDAAAASGAGTTAAGAGTSTAGSSTAAATGIVSTTTGAGTAGSGAGAAVGTASETSGGAGPTAAGAGTAGGGTASTGSPGVGTGTATSGGGTATQPTSAGGGTDSSQSGGGTDSSQSGGATLAGG